MKILIVEDDPISTLLLRRTIARLGHKVDAAPNAQEAVSHLEADPSCRLVISDCATAGIDGLKLCRRIRARFQESYVYVILVTGTDRRMERLEGLRAGADDCLTRPLDAIELAARIDLARRFLDLRRELCHRGMELEQLRAELVHRSACLSELALTDALTGLKNRRHFTETFEAQFAFAERSGTPLSLAMIDVDQFKSYNDAFGHPAGDRVLTRISSVLQENVRQHDLVARYGGEEFVLLLPGSDVTDGIDTAERLRDQIEKYDWPRRPITASFGIASRTPETPDPSALLLEADIALYRSKQAGRNRVTHHLELLSNVSPSPLAFLKTPVAEGLPLGLPA